MTDFSAIQAFVQVVEAKSFAGAAPPLKMTASGVSRAISRLETQLRIRLLYRSTRVLRLTEEGAAFYERCKQILADLTDATEAVSSARLKPEGKLRIATAMSIGRIGLIPNLPDFQARYPDIQVELAMGDRSVDLIEAGIDCAIRVGELADSSLIARKLGQFRVVTCASPAYLQRFGTPASVQDLRSHRCIGYVSENTGKPWPWQFETAGGRITVDLDSHLTINDAESVIQAGMMGLGIIQTGDCLVASHLMDGKLRPILNDAVTLGPPFWIVYPQKKYLSARVQVFIDWITELFGRSARACKSLGLKAYGDEQPAIPGTHDRYTVTSGASLELEEQ